MEALLNSNLKAAAVAPSIFRTSSRTSADRIPSKSTPFPPNLLVPRNLWTLNSRALTNNFFAIRVLQKPTVGISSEISRTVSEQSTRGLDTKPTILVAEKLGEAGLEVLRTLANVDCSYNLTPEELCAKISHCDAIIVRSGTKVTRQVFESSRGRLKVVGRAGVGIDNVDLHAATEYGCLVVNAPTANTVAAAEHGIALLAAMARNVSQASTSMKQG